MRKSASKTAYNSKADILTFEAGRSAKIDYAREFGDVIVHFTKDNSPVLVEILNASRQLFDQKSLLRQMKTLA